MTGKAGDFYLVFILIAYFIVPSLPGKRGSIFNPVDIRFRGYDFHLFLCL